MRRPLAALALLPAAWLAGPAPAAAKDVTTQVVRETDLDERLVAVCRAYCLGNRSGATLNQVTVVRATGSTYRVAGRASLRNHQFVEPAIVFGAQVGGFDLFHYIVTIDAVGTLDGPTCKLRVDRVQVLDDRLGLTDIARREEGKTYLVPDCQRFLAGL
jgi:hypothetical protein